MPLLRSPDADISVHLTARVAKVIVKSGTPFAAKKSAGRVVTSKSSTTRNFISAKYGEITWRGYR